ncbi:hypothetical protein MUK42_05527 [Musa troglodytarum]|uniref:Uncharacterized protein n=1 Tax=Musa troglodytarum TaxID=320322 RepID=A0A9E7F1U5_9LILI|nr:hypothetical protein MUK42_05527 [Musa troglodytarum]
MLTGAAFFHLVCGRRHDRDRHARTSRYFYGRLWLQIENFGPSATQGSKHLSHHTKDFSMAMSIYDSEEYVSYSNLIFIVTL